MIKKLSLILVILCLLFSGVASAESDFFEYTNLGIINGMYVITAPVSGGAPLNLSVYMPVNSSGVQGVYADSLFMNVPVTSLTQSYVFNVEIKNPSDNQKVADGVLHYDFQSVSAPTANFFAVWMDITNWNSSKITPVTLSPSLIINCSDSRFAGITLYRSANSDPSIPLGINSLAYFSGKVGGTAYWAFGTTSSTQSAVYIKSFKNEIYANKNLAGIISYGVDKTNPGINGVSQVNITLSGGSTIVGGFDQTDVIGTTPLSPVYIQVYEPITNTYFRKAYYAPIFNYSVSPNSVTYGESTTGFLTSSTGDFQTVKALNYYYMDPDNSGEIVNLYEQGSTTKQLKYVFRTPNWYGWDTNTGDFSNNKGTSIILRPIVTPRHSGNLSIGVYVYDIYGNYQDIKNYLTVTSNSNLQKITIRAQDSFTGNYVTPTTFSIKNLITNTWKNQSEMRIGQIDDYYAVGTTLQMQASAAGWATNTITKSVLNGNGATISYTIPMYPYSSPLVNYTQLYISVVNNALYTPISGATVRISSCGYTTNCAEDQYGVTTASGITSFNVSNSTTYYASATAAGYNGGEKVVFTNGATTQTAIQLVQLGVTPTPQITVPTYVITNTPTPIQTNIGGGQINGTPTICKTNTSSLSPVESLKNAIACFGFDEYLAQSLALAGLIIMVFVVIGGKAGKALGAALGGIIGFLLCVTLGILPLWILIAFIVIGVGAIAIKALLSDG
jgi:hypothetical protein